MFAQIVMGIVGLLWIFPFIWFAFGEENTWWVMSLIISIGAIAALTGLTKIFDAIDKETRTKGNDVFYLYDYTDLWGDK